VLYENPVFYSLGLLATVAPLDVSCTSLNYSSPSFDSVLKRRFMKALSYSSRDQCPGISGAMYPNYKGDINRA